MDAREPTAGDLAKARTEQERGGDDDKVARRTEVVAGAG
jgi:hypothetical protein